MRTLVLAAAVVAFGATQALAFGNCSGAVHTAQSSATVAQAENSTPIPRKPAASQQGG